MKHRLGMPLWWMACSTALHGQMTYSGAFVRHSVTLTAPSECVNGTTTTTYSSSSVTIPISGSCKGALISGQITLAYPAATPPGTEAFGTVQFQSALKTSIEVTGKWTTPAKNYTGSAWVSSLQSLDQRGDWCRAVNNAGSLAQGTFDFSAKRPCEQGRVWGQYETPFDNSRLVLTLHYHAGANLSGPGASTPTAAVSAEITTTYILTGAAPPPPPDLAVDHFEVVQVVQDPLNSVTLIAGKNTVARVFVKLDEKASGPMNGVTGRLLGFRDDRELPGSPLSPVNGFITASKTFERTNVNHSLNFRLPKEWTAPGTLRLVADVAPPAGLEDPKPDNNLLMLDTVFTAPANLPSRLYVHYWPVCYEPLGRPRTCPGNQVATSDVLLRKLYPFADDGVFYQRWLIPNKIWTQPLATNADVSKLVASLRKVYDMMLDQVVGGADQLAVWFPPGLTGLLGLSDPAWAKTGGRGRVSYNVDSSATDRLDPAFTLAHETAHNLGLRHNNTADSCNALDPSPENKWPYADATIHEIGLDPSTLEVKPATKKDLMTYCSPPASNIWISPYHFKLLTDSQTLTRETPAANFSKPGAARRADGAECLIVSGSARRDGAAGRLDPAYRVTSSIPAAPSDASGNHCLRFSGADGMLANYCFTLTFESHRSHEPLEEESFSLKAPFPAATTRVALMRGEQELAALSASRSAPVVEITAPQAGDKWEGSHAITWNASDPDGNPLAYSVLYSPDAGQSWLPLETDIQNQRFTFDTAEIQCGTQVYFRVLASNGINTASARVGPVEIVQAPKIEAAPASLNFGSVLVGQAADSAVSLDNQGNGPLTVRSLDGLGGAFSVVSPAPPFTVPPGGRQEVTVRFSPAAAGAQTGTLSIRSDDPSGATATVSLTGLGVPAAAPRLEVTPEGLDFGEVAAGQTRELTLTLRNAGGAELSVSSIASSSAQFAVPAPSIPFSLAAGAEQAVTVRFSAGSAGQKTGALTIASNDPGRAAVTVSLVAQDLTPAALPPPPPASVLFSDTFNRADADRCSLGQMDLGLGGSGARYYLPTFPNGTPATPFGANIVAGALQNNSQDFGGVQFAASAGACSTTGIRGQNIGQDLNIRSDLLVPTDASGRITQAGLYLRNRAAARGDGILGGDSAGYWIQLHSTGEVKVKNVNAQTVVAASARPASFNTAIFHQLEVAAQGSSLQVALDGVLVTFTQNGASTTTVSIPATSGSNNGTAGIAFGAEGNRGLIGGQRADNLIVTAFRALAK